MYYHRITVIPSLDETQKRNRGPGALRLDLREIQDRPIQLDTNPAPSPSHTSVDRNLSPWNRGNRAATSSIYIFLLFYIHYTFFRYYHSSTVLLKFRLYNRHAGFHSALWCKGVELRQCRCLVGWCAQCSGLLHIRGVRTLTHATHARNVGLPDY